MGTDRHDDWYFGSVGVLLVGALTAVAGVVAYPYHWYHLAMPAGVAAGCALLVCLAGRVRRVPAGLVGYRVGCWLSLGGWATATNALGMSVTMFVVLAGVLVGLGLVMPLATPDVPAAAALPGGRGELTTGEAWEWKLRVDRICRISKPGVRVTGLHRWDNGTGFRLVLEGPPGSGFTFQALAENIARLAADARLKPGCVPAASEGDDHQGQAYLDVPTVYDLAEARTYPQDYSPLTVNQDIPIGIFPDGTLVYIEVREGSMMLIGRKGGGKTTLLWNITASLARCRDALIWHIDLNNGGMSAPWLIPWLEGKCEYPVIDWFGFDVTEALWMSRVGLAIALHRKKVYARRKVQRNATLLPLGEDLPEIVIMVDESAEALGEDSTSVELGENLRKIMRLGRDSGVNVLLSSLRPVGDHVPVQLRKNCAVKIGMLVEEKDEYDYLFENSRGCHPHMIKNKGEAFIFRSGVDTAPIKWRSFDMKPNQLVEISVATSGLHPEMDEKSLPQISMWEEDPYAEEGDTPRMVSAYEVYLTRWDRAGDYLAAMMADDDHAHHDPAPAGTPVQTELEAGGVTVKERPPVDPDFEATVLAGLAALPVAEPVRPDRGRTQTLSDGARLVVRIVTAPMMMADILEAVGRAGRDVTRQTVYEWTQEAVAAGIVEGTRKRGQYQPCGWTAPECGS